jgi:ferredoxin--NADP+ reductase
MSDGSAPPGASGNPLRVAVVGSGPAGFYAAEALLGSGLEVEIDLIERLPVPYGLVRHGVAPDHARLKSVAAVFDAIARDPRCRFFGNVALGREIDAAALAAMYHAVIVCTGAQAERRLGMPGEQLLGVHAARDFVGWYNGLPECADLRFDLSQEVVAILGLGNVAIDVCRLLAKPLDELRTTDIAAHALEALAASRVREIHLIGRRGPVQARFTPKELRELGSLGGWQVRVDPADLALEATSRAELADPATVHAPKIIEILRGFAAQSQDRRGAAGADRTVRFHFHAAPVALQGDGRLDAVVLERQALAGPPGAQIAVPTGERYTLPAGLMLRSIGYRGCALPGLPFDEPSGTLPHRRGRVLAANGQPLRPWYTSGWIKRGPIGVIGTNRLDSVETVASLLEDLEGLDRDKPGRAALQAWLDTAGHRVIGHGDWLAIERVEQARGRAQGKVAEKFVRVPEMLAAADTGSQGGFPEVKV